ncbi:ABC-type sugar transport system, substrate-binding protein, contains N-terminal xre family HTH domain [Sporobacter termitidis DSM 10068]|uniref:ABC-type sugar transport system, substrate-binding protein, contains N-terminal xre family HTH domain n=1 Tax=Sporobacter termitidis DSM 10068 TaxID=1123282 RepID=A0A1M5TPZ9_9FIRM|nr:substrate-binding domain-containing protein [Sporobacter termitidis]SHH52779.1 ABC-type sugar transport system, substrate-binding protein, contains N-terminal xre family HTH domain [Sporobacter termitidis DSM 10068]
MKKVLTVLLALLMILALFACNSQQPGSTGTGSPSPSVSAATPDASPSASATPLDVTENADELGFFTDGVDPGSRKTYNILFAYPYTLLLFTNLMGTLQELAPRLNINVTSTTGEHDVDKYLENIQTLADQRAIDGIIIIFDSSAIQRIHEVCTETGLPFVVVLNADRDPATQSELAPCVGSDDVIVGETETQWLYDNYKTYWGDIDKSEIALVSTNASVRPNLNDRAVGAESKFKELLPGNTIFPLDMTQDVTQDTAYNQASALFSAHPEIKYWWVTNAIETHAQGVARAIETVGLQDKVLMIDVGSDIMVSEWNNDYDGAWKACVATSNYQYMSSAACAVVAMIDGKATPESLWASQRAPGDKCTFLNLPNEVLTKETYKESFNKYAKLAGVSTLPYPEQ